MEDKFISTEALFIALFNPQAGKTTGEIIRGAGLELERVQNCQLKKLEVSRKVCKPG